MILVKGHIITKKRKITAIIHVQLMYIYHEIEKAGPFHDTLKNLAKVILFLGGGGGGGGGEGGSLCLFRSNPIT